MASSTRMIGKPKGLLQRRAALIAWVVVLTVAAVLDAVWLFSDDRASPNYPLVVSAGLIGGVALGLVLAYVWDRHAGRLKNNSDVKAATGLPVLGVVPAMRLEGAERVVVTGSQAVEGRQAYRFLAANLAHTRGKSGRACLLITSPTRGDGRTTTAVNLSMLLAAEGQRVALVSADPNGEGVEEVLGLERRPGLTEVLDGSSPLDSALQPSGVERLRVLTAGGTSGEALGQSLAPLLERITRSVDLVVIDAPPVLSGLEAALLARDVDQVLVVVDVRHGKRADASTAVAYLGHVQDKLVGCVANHPGPRRSRRRHDAPAAAPAAAPATAPEAARTAPAGPAAAIAAAAAAGSTPAAAGAAQGRVMSAAPLGALRRHPWAGVIAAALAAALVISSMWWLSYDGRTEAQNGPDQTPDTSLAATSSSGQAAVAAAMDECESTWDAQTEPLDAAATSLQQWQVHVDAMNQLVAGEITLDQASAFWEQSRVEAAQKIHRFHSMDATYTAGEDSCRTPDIAGNSVAGLAALTACQHDIAQRDDALQAGRVAIGTWHHHVMDMNLMRAGTLSPARAVQLWNKNWKEGVAELHDYRSQLRQTGNQHC